MIEALTGEVEENDGYVDWRVKPALLTLLRDQTALLDANKAGDVLDGDLRRGFPTRRSLIEWYQSATVRTLGNIADEWPPADCINDEPLVSALIRIPGQGIPVMPSRKATRFRQVLEAEIVQPACNKAYRQLRPVANEYVKTDDSEKSAEGAKALDPSKQQHLAMRPGFRALDRQQRLSLDALWGGFESEDALMDWLHGLNSPTNGEVYRGLPQAIVGDDVAMRYLIHDREAPAARTYREVLAVAELLPAFVSGVKSVETGELAKATQDTPTTYRMK